MPLWLAAAPVAMTYTVAAGKAGLTALEIQLMSLFVYSAPTQMGIVQLWADDSPASMVLLMVLIMNVHHILYGFSLSRWMNLSRVQRALSAAFLTDAAYAVTVTAPQNTTFAFLFGAELSLYLTWNAFTMLGVWLGHRVVIPSSVSLDFVAPLTFLALLISTVKTRMDVRVILIAAAVAALCLSVQVGAFTIVIAALVGALASVWMENTLCRVSKANGP